MTFMEKHELRFLLMLLISGIILFQACNQTEYPKREMRAVWVATVRNIDWPSEPGLPVRQQKNEITALLDQHKANGMNAIVFQVRPGCDALYASALEPWSRWLTGIQGEAPEPLYDPLQMFVDECRKRNMELHAWFNPYRAVVNFAENPIDSNHVASRHPEWILTYGDNRYLNPGLQEVRDYVCNVVADVVRRYDIAAVHMDDYFYPYKIEGQEFPDEEAFLNFPDGFLPEQKEDWRRHNVDLIIKQLQDTIKSIKPCVQLGISPFGVWRNKDKDPAGSETASKQTNYDDLYADILLWLKEGWIDYVVPQAYWHIGFEIADHQKIAEWWDSNSFNRNLYIGNGVHRFDRKSKTKQWRSSKELVKQLELDRNLKNVSGNFYFNSRAFQRNPVKLNKAIQKKIYPYPALIPVNPALPVIRPEPPVNLQFTPEGKEIKITWDPGSANTWYYVVYCFRKKDEIDLSDPTKILSITMEPGISVSKKDYRNKNKFLITAVSRTHHESKASVEIMISEQGAIGNLKCVFSVFR